MMPAALDRTAAATARPQAAWPARFRRRRDGFAGLAATALLIVAAAGPAPGQTEASGRLGLEYAAARIRYEEAEKQLGRAEELFENELLSEAELDTEKAQLRLADLDLAQAYLEMIAADPEVVLRAARKYRRPDGEARVELELVARWSSGVEAEVVEQQSGGLLDLPLPTGVSNVIVSLKTVRGHREGVLLEPTIVSVPYEQRVPMMLFDEPTTVDFGLLLADVEELLVELRYNHQTHDRQVLLGKRSGAEEPLVVRSAQLALDAELGEEAEFVLEVERFDVDDATYGVRLEGLPPEVAARLSDPETEATFSQMFLSEGVTSRSLRLELTLPSRPTVAVQPGTSIPFSVLFEPDDDAAGGAGSLDLELIPRGVAALEVEAANLYQEILRGDTGSFEVRIVNAGSLDLEQVEVVVEAPFGWRVGAEPRLFDALAPGAGEAVNVTLAPPADVILGDYEGTIVVGTLAGDRLVESDPKTVRIHVTAARNPWLALLLLAAVVALLAALIRGGILLSRR